jgi:hypothetical protein
LPAQAIQDGAVIVGSEQSIDSIESFTPQTHFRFADERVHLDDQPSPIDVETEDEYIHVRYRDPDEFETIRTPDWADEVSDSVSAGSEVRTGKRADSDDWEIQSVLVDTHVGEQQAREQADEIVEKIEG